VGISSESLGHANPREASVIDDASLSFLLLNSLPWDACLLFSTASRRPEDDQLLVIGFEGYARGTAFDRDVVGAQERDQVGCVPVLLQARDFSRMQVSRLVMVGS
jgi:hypothetical protein